MKVMYSIEKGFWRIEKRIWLCFFSSVHIVSHPEEEKEVDWNPFPALKCKDNSTGVLSKDTCASEVQGLLPTHAHLVYDKDLT